MVASRSGRACTSKLLPPKSSPPVAAYKAQIASSAVLNVTRARLQAICRSVYTDALVPRRSSTPAVRAASYHPERQPVSFAMDYKYTYFNAAPQPYPFMGMPPSGLPLNVDPETIRSIVCAISAGSRPAQPVFFAFGD